MQTQTIRKVGSVHIGALLQLFATHLLVGFFVCIGLNIGPGILIVLLASLVGVALTLNISSSLHLLELMLDRLNERLPLELPSLRWRWPLTPLFARVNALDRTGKSTLLDQQASEFRAQLSRQVDMTAAQEERNRLARDLHDSIKQQIFSIVVSAAAVKARWERDSAGARRTVDEIEHTALEAQIEMQALLQQLRPHALENVGLIESLRMQCQALGYRTGADVQTELAELPSDAELPLGTQEVIFRIVQEGFANIARHARAEHVWLSLQRQRDALLVEIGDDGQGFALGKQRRGYGGMGMANMRERARSLGGQLAIWSQLDQGTTLHLYFPLIKEAGEIHSQVEDTRASGAVARTRKVLGIGMKAIELAAILVLLYTPAPFAALLVGGAFLVALCAWLWSQRARMQVVLSMGRKSAHTFALQAESYALLAGLALLLLSELGYLKYTIFAQANILPIVGPPLIGMGLCAIAFGVAAIGSLVARERAYRRMPEQTLQPLLMQKLRESLFDLVVWVLVTILIFTLTTVHFYTLPNIGVVGWVEDSGLFVLALWLVCSIVRLGQITRWLMMRKAVKA